MTVDRRAVLQGRSLFWGGVARPLTPALFATHPPTHTKKTNLKQSIAGREVCVYSISCKNQTNIDLTLQWLTKHAKT